MGASGSTIVVDVGKTLSKVSLWSRDGRMLDRQVRPNASCSEAGLSRLDIHGIGEWLRGSLARYAGQPVERIVPVGHGAGVVAIRGDAPAFGPLDYEQVVPAAVSNAYERERDPFPVTGSPSLPAGLNMGRQLFWLDQVDPGAMTGSTLVPWAQYWAWFLSGQAVSEVTSLGCHSDLWVPAEGGYSELAQRRGWAARFGPLAKAADVIGTLRSELADVTGLPHTTEVLAGLHDSNAALLAARGFDEIARNEATVLSTGTWFIAMRLPGQAAPSVSLPESRDTLMNVDAYGQPVPSARLMGGREIEMLIEIDTRRVDIVPDQPNLLAAVPALLERGTVLTPTLTPGCGPFPEGTSRWIDRPAKWTEDWFARRAAACLYAALVADASLDLIGASERLLIEGRFSEAQVFVRALAALRPRTQVFVANAHNDVSFGALRLIDPSLKPQGDLQKVLPLEGDLAAYREKWRAAVSGIAE